MPVGQANRHEARPDDPPRRVGDARHLYDGPPPRDYVPIERRGRGDSA
jgi:hypothetical protein